MLIRRKWWLLLGFWLAICLSWAQVAKAGSLTIEPLRTELELKPGQATTQVLRVKNTGPKPAHVRLTAEAFSVTNESYDYSFDTSDKLEKWVRFPVAEADLQPGETRSFDCLLGAPPDAEPGGKYISLLAAFDTKVTKSSEITGAESGLQSVERAASLVYITIPGDVLRSGKFTSLTTPLLVFGRSTTWTARLNNTGNVHYRSGINISIKSLWGGAVITSQSLDRLLLPASVRKIDGDIKAPAWPGAYWLEASAGLGDGPLAVRRSLILVQPLVLLGIFIVVLGSSLLVWQKRRQPRSY